MSFKIFIRTFITSTGDLGCSKTTAIKQGGLTTFSGHRACTGEAVTTSWWPAATLRWWVHRRTTTTADPRVHRVDPQLQQLILVRVDDINIRAIRRPPAAEWSGRWMRSWYGRKVNVGGWPWGIPRCPEGWGIPRCTTPRSPNDSEWRGNSWRALKRLTLG